MSGLYIHIPFCKQACSYCDFYFTTHQHEKENFLKALDSEIAYKFPTFKLESIKTIYFGGGTPSQLSIPEINGILNTIKAYADIADLEEVTLEANPENLNIEFLRRLKSETIINRLSIGIQSFHDRELKLMHRTHNANSAISAFKNAREAGFDNISMDLIYGVPGSDLKSWLRNVEEAVKLNPEHISAYCLTIENNTRLKYWIEKGRYKYPEEELILKQSELLMEFLQDAGYDQYEISNFSKPNKYSKHNTSYWFGESFIGLGPSAHSFHSNERHWNVRSTRDYIKAIKKGTKYWESEKIDLNTAYNEFVMTRLRTKWGIKTSEIQLNFGDKYAKYLENQVNILVKGLASSNNGIIKLTNKGKHLADGIAADLFYISK